MGLTRDSLHPRRDVYRRVQAEALRARLRLSRDHALAAERIAREVGDVERRAAILKAWMNLEIAMDPNGELPPELRRLIEQEEESSGKQ